MGRATRTFTAVTTAMVVLAAHALCVCRTTRAAAASPASPASAHNCCKHDAPGKSPASDKHSHDTDGHCRHCDGFAAPAVKAGDSGLAHVPALLAVPPGLGGAGRPSFQASNLGSNASPLSDFVPPSTLLRLCCALNL